MSMTIQGTLTVQVIQGRRGPFKTAKLATSIGTFDVKNPILKQFEPGNYEGNFILNQLKVKTFEWGGGATSYIDAALDWQHLADFAQECGLSDEAEVQSSQASTGDPVSESGTFDPVSESGTFDPVSENGIEFPKFAESLDQVEHMIENKCSHISFGEYILADREELKCAVELVREAGYSYSPREKRWYV